MFLHWRLDSGRRRHEVASRRKEHVNTLALWQKRRRQDHDDLKIPGDSPSDVERKESVKVTVSKFRSLKNRTHCVTSAQSQRTQRCAWWEVTTDVAGTSQLRLLIVNDRSDVGHRKRHLKLEKKNCAVGINELRSKLISTYHDITEHSFCCEADSRSHRDDILRLLRHKRFIIVFTRVGHGFPS